MTSLIAWVAEASDSPSGLYIASDSRLSWGERKDRPPTHTWDYGKKLFASKQEPLIVGYTGDVLFVTLALSQLMEVIDAGMFFADGTTVSERTQQIGEYLDSLRPFPEENSSTIICGWRTGRSNASTVSVFQLDIPRSGATSVSALNFSTSTPIVYIGGSGRPSVEKWTDIWFDGLGKKLSRAVFSGFADAVASSEDGRTGGAVQLVGLYRAGAARLHATFRKGRGAALAGMPMARIGAGVSMEFRNELFERTDRNGARLPKAQRHSVPASVAEARRRAGIP